MSKSTGPESKQKKRVNDFMSNLGADHASRSAFESIQTSFRTGAEVVNTGVKQFKFNDAYKKYNVFKLEHPVLDPHDFKVSVSGIKDEEKNILERMNNVQIIIDEKEDIVGTIGLYKVDEVLTHRNSRATW